MSRLNAYLSFDGQCAEAMKLYAEVLGAKLDALITYGMPGGPPVPPEHAGGIMHAMVTDRFGTDWGVNGGSKPMR
jgi:PhnB protein